MENWILDLVKPTGVVRASLEDAGLLDDPPCGHQSFQQLSDTVATARTLTAAAPIEPQTNADDVTNLHAGCQLTASGASPFHKGSLVNWASSLRSSWNRAVSPLPV